MRRSVIVPLAAAALASLLGVARADECLVAARSEYKDTLRACVDGFQAAKDACIGRDHDCVDVCRVQREDCQDASGLDAALDACAATRDAAVAQCKATYPPETTSRDACIDDAQVAAFQCRDAAREAAKPALLVCRQAFRGCVRACPVTGAAVDVAACKQAATAGLKACKATGREDYQIAKDACLHRDHDCVEACREARATCNAPVQDQLDADVASCNAARSVAVAACNGDEACIDAAQVVAFQCRDQAREDAKPGFTACRAAFKACVVGPPGCAIVS